MLPPAVALVVVATSIGLQRRTLATLETANGLLRQHIATARDGSPGTAAARAQSAAPDIALHDQGRLDWKKLAGQLAAMRNSDGMGDLRSMMRLQQRIMAMTRDELVAALDEIATLDLPAASRAMLEEMLIGPLIQKDPELALARFSDRLQDDRGGMAWQLASALQEWAKKDAAKASAWFDQQIAAGKFDSKSLDGQSPSRILFEGALMGVLLSSDPAAAGQRLAALPADQRAEVMRLANNSLKEQDQLAFAKLVRDQVPAEEQARIFSQQASQLVSQGGYAKVSDYLTRIEATPAERSACVEQVAVAKITFNRQNVTREDLDAMRQWVGSQAPDATDRITGITLDRAVLSKNTDFAAAADLAVQYGQASGTDDVLGTFLESHAARNNKDQARVLAAQIADEKRRAEILKGLQ